MVLQLIDDQVSAVLKRLDCKGERNNALDRSGGEVAVEFGRIGEKDFFITLEFEMNGNLLIVPLKRKILYGGIEKLNDLRRNRIRNGKHIHVGERQKAFNRDMLPVLFVVGDDDAGIIRQKDLVIGTDGKGCHIRKVSKLLLRVGGR